jgi:archaellum biogenesis protein FlaJ (TadC family)
MLQKIKQQFLDNAVLLTFLAFAAISTSRSTQVKVELNDLSELRVKIAELDARCLEMERMREDMDDLRYAFAKAVTSRTVKTVSKAK